MATSERKDASSNCKEEAATKMWNECKDLAELSLEHSFVTSIANGSLSRESFQLYIIQDAFFLKAFARSYSLAAEKALDASLKKVILQLIDAVNDEITMHFSFAKSWGVALESEMERGCLLTSTFNYVDFLYKTAEDLNSDCGFIMAAMAPCMMLYSYIGTTLNLRYPPPENKNLDTPYRSWIDTYSSDEFSMEAKKIENLLNHFSERQSEEYLKHAKKLFRRAMELEYEFFNSFQKETQ